MANTKVSALDAITDAASTDEIYIVDDATGTPVSKKITVANLLKVALYLSQVLDEDDMASDSATYPASQQSVKAYVDGAIDTDVATHAALTASHGVSGAIVGTTDSQSLTNKTIDADSNTVSNIALGAEASGAVNDLSDVTITTPADNEVLAYDSGGAWINQTAAEAGLSATGHTHTESDVTDLDKYTQAEVDSAIDTDVATHAALTVTHGVSGTIVGTSDSQTLTNKTIGAAALSGQMSAADNIIERPVIKDYGETVDTEATSGASYTIDCENGNVHDVTLTANCTFTFSNPPASGTAGSFTLILRQDGTGSRTVTWPASVDWASATAPTLSTGAADVDVFTFLTVDAGTTWLGFTAGLDIS